MGIIDNTWQQTLVTSSAVPSWAVWYTPCIASGSNVSVMAPGGR